MLDINYLKEKNVDIDKSLEYLQDIETYNETCQDFLAEIDSKLEELQKSKEENNLANYAVYAHSIKSDARYLGFNEVMQVALDHEMAGKNNDDKFINENYERLVDKTKEMISIIKEYLGDQITQQNEILTMESMNTPVVIVADDSSLVSNFISKAIKNKYNILVAKDGKEIIDIINSHKYKIVALLLDLNMPNMGGFEVLDYFKEQNLFETIPVSIITGEDSKDMINKAFTYNIVDMLVKPFNDKEVSRVVDKTVNFMKFPR